MLSKVLSLDKLSCPQIWNIEQKEDREKEKVGASETQREKGRQGFRTRDKKQRRHFFVGRRTGKFCSGGDEMRNASGHQSKVKMRGSEREHVRHFLRKTCN